MSKTNTKATINANIKQNGNQEITGQILNSVLNQMVDDYGTQEDMTAVQTAIPTLATKTELTALVNDVKRIGLNVNYKDAIRLTAASFDSLSMKTSIINVLDTDKTILACILPSTMTNSGWLYEYEEGWRLCKVNGFTLTNTSTWENLLDWMDEEGHSTKIAGETAINEIKAALTEQEAKLTELDSKVGEFLGGYVRLNVDVYNNTSMGESGNRIFPSGGSTTKRIDLERGATYKFSSSAGFVVGYSDTLYSGSSMYLSYPAVKSDEFVYFNDSSYRYMYVSGGANDVDVFKLVGEGGYVKDLAAIDEKLTNLEDNAPYELVDMSSHANIDAVLVNGNWSTLSGYKSKQVSLDKKVKKVIIATDRQSAYAFLFDGYRSSQQIGRKANIVGATAETTLAANVKTILDVPDGASVFNILSRSNGTYVSIDLELVMKDTDSGSIIANVNDAGAAIIDRKFVYISGYDSMNVAVSPNSFYKVVANDSNGAVVTMLKSAPVLGEFVSLCDGCVVDEFAIPKGDYRIIKTPADAHYINIATFTKELTPNSRRPLSVEKVESVAIPKADGEVYVSAYNSSPNDKMISDFVCSGANDQVTLQAAVNMAAKKANGGAVILMQGNYKIGGFNSNRIAVELPSGNPHLTDISFNSNNFVIKGYLNNVDNVIVELTDDAFNALDSENEYKIFANSSFSYNHHIIKDLHINIPKSTKKVICIDGSQMGSTGLENVICNVVDRGDYTHIPTELPNYGCIGIRGNFGSNNQRSYEWKNCECYGFGQGFAAGGEHLLMIKCFAIYCRYGYTFNSYPSSANTSIHPITLIDSCDEWNMNLPLFCTLYKNGAPRTDYKQAVVFINFNLEKDSGYMALEGNLITEQTPGQYCGQIGYTLTGTQKLFADGSGYNINAENYAHPKFGTTSQRTALEPNQMQQFYDTTLNKMCYCIDRDTKKWVDANGNIL